MSQIEFKNVSKIYPNGHVGLKDINLNIEKGDFAVIVGLSGAGNLHYYDLLIVYMILLREILQLKVNRLRKRKVKNY